MIKIVCFSLLLLPFSSLANACNELSKINWLLGDWQSPSHDSVIVTEQWRAQGSSIFNGIGQTIKEGKVSWSEQLRIGVIDNEIYYFAKVPNNPEPVAFKLTNCSENSVTFENPEHDFPKKIHYLSPTPTELMVIVSDGKDKMFTVEFGKVTRAKDE